MLATARGVTLGLGKINLADLKIDLKHRGDASKQRRPTNRLLEPPKIVIKKHIDTKTLWAACRAVVFGSVVIVTGIMMTILGYFDLNLSEEVSQNLKTGETIISVNWTKRYALKSLQYLGPVMMGLGSFVLIIACVITLEYRDKHAQVFKPETGDTIKTSMSPVDDTSNIIKHKPLTNEEIRNWTPNMRTTSTIDFYGNLPLYRRERYRSTSCIPQLLEFVDTRRLYERLMDTYYDVARSGEEDLECGDRRYERGCTSAYPIESIERSCSTRQSVVAEVHEHPESGDLVSVPVNRLSSMCSSNDDSARLWSARTNADDQSWGVTERRAPLASLDIELRSTSSSSSPNVNRNDQDIRFVV